MASDSGSMYCARCGERSPARSVKCAKCGFEFASTNASTLPQLPVARSKVPLAAQTGQIYRPKQESEMLPGAPFWLLLYTFCLAVMGIAWVGVTINRFANNEIAQHYGGSAGSIFGIVTIIVGVFLLIVAIATVRLTRPGWQVMRITSLLWIGASIVLWICGLSVISVNDRFAFVIASVLALSSFAGLQTIEGFIEGTTQLQDAADFNIPRFIPRPRVIILPGSAATAIVGSVLAYMILPIIITLISAIAMFPVMSVLILEPSAWLQMDGFEKAAAGLVLVGGAINHLLLLDLLHLERPRFWLTRNEATE